MNNTSVSSEWAASRGQKWLANLAGIEAMMTPVDEPLLQALSLNQPCRIADVGCGGGGTTLEVFRRAPAGSIAHGFDISPALIALARTRKPPAEPGIVFEVADVAKATPPGEPYDLLVSRFGIMFFDEPLAAFTNLARWLKPGGSFAFAAWDDPAKNPWSADVDRVVSEFAALPSVDPTAPGRFRYAEASVLLSLLENAGFAEVKVTDWRGPFAVGGGLLPSEAAKFALAAFGSFDELLTEAGEHTYLQAHRSLTAHFSEKQQNGIVQVDAAVHIFTGVRNHNSETINP